MSAIAMSALTSAPIARRGNRSRWPWVLPAGLEGGLGGGAGAGAGAGQLASVTIHTLASGGGDSWGEFESVVFHPSIATLLACASTDATVRLFAVAPATGLLEPVNKLCGHEDAVWSVTFHPTIPTLLASASSDSTAKVWRHDTGECVATLKGPAHNIAVRPLRPPCLAAAGSAPLDQRSPVASVAHVRCLPPGAAGAWPSPVPRPRPRRHLRRLPPVGV